MHKFLIRSASGIVYAAVIILAIVHGGWSLWLLAIAFAVIGVCELDHMAVGFSKRLGRCMRSTFLASFRS